MSRDNDAQVFLIFERKLLPKNSLFNDNFELWIFTQKYFVTLHIRK